MARTTQSLDHLPVRNTHERLVDLPIADARALLATLAGPDDRVWPTASWPRMRVDRGLVVGAVGGHGPVPYTVTEVSPDRIAFAFAPRFGLAGGHALELEPAGRSTRVRHDLWGTPSGAMRLAWPLLFEPLHDALVEDALDRVARAAGGPAVAVWSPQVRRLRVGLRWLVGGASSPDRALAGAVSGLALAGLAGVHLAWAAGSAWPAASRADLAAEVVGADHVPSAAACAGVAGLLTVAAAAVGDGSGARRTGPVGRAAGLGAAAVLAGRGVAGLAANPWLRRSRPRFAARDARIYSPLCLALAAGMTAALRPAGSRSHPSHEKT